MSRAAAQRSAPAAAPGNRRQQESERRRQAVLAAAQACFGRDGYAGATVARIAEEAGVSQGLLYQFYPSKEALFDQVLRDVLRDWVRQMLSGDAKGASAADKIEGMFRRSVAFCKSHPLLGALMAGDPALQLERLSVAAKDRVEPHRKLVAELLSAGIAAGELRADLDVPAAADVICQLQGEYSRRAWRKDPLRPLTPRILDEAVRFIRAAIESQEAPA